MSDVVVVSTDELRALIREAVAEAIPEQTEGPSKTWYTLREAAELKGISYDVLRKRPRWERPNFGEATSMIDGSRKYQEVYHRDHVIPWLEKTSEELTEAYRDFLYSEKKEPSTGKIDGSR